MMLPSVIFIAFGGNILSKMQGREFVINLISPGRRKVTQKEEYDARATKISTDEHWLRGKGESMSSRGQVLLFYNLCSSLRKVTVKRSIVSHLGPTIVPSLSNFLGQC